ncbi:putative membrane transporter protein [Pandoravirus salinus]|uniref:Putative membrane transporter protein n=1 Tax=Pandoravirus salinus TaxID=1349410 RepID=A0A291ATH8_9VIRU|nr:putative membrane transporter protein [Pandoravirus salinus]ATE82135.1 putative membrane transporter protein [Pandoravirus salinus]
MGRKNSHRPTAPKKPTIRDRHEANSAKKKRGMTDLLVDAALQAAATMAAGRNDSGDGYGDTYGDTSPVWFPAATVYDVPDVDLVRVGVVAAASIVAAAVSAVTAFGMAVTFHAIAHGVAAAGLATIDTGAAVAYLMCMAIPAFWPLAIAHRRHIWWPLVGVLFVPSAAFTYVGTLLLADQPPTVLRPLLGAAMLAIALWEAARTNPHAAAAATARKAPDGLTTSSDPATTSDPFCEVAVDPYDDTGGDSVDEREAMRPLLSPPSKATQRQASLSVGVVVLAVACGVVSGLLGGMLCLHGPPLMIFAAVVAMPVERMRATMMCLFGAVSVLQIGFLWGHGLFDWHSQWPCYVAATAGSAIGTKLGDMACKHVPPAAVYWGILVLLIVTGVSLITGSVEGALAYAVICAAIVLFALALLFQLQKHRQ